MRDLFVFGVVILTLPLVFRRPFIGLLVFSWLAYMRPQDLCWGFARSMRLSFFVGLTMTVGWFANESGLRRFWRRDVRTVLMIALAALITVSLSMARNLDNYVVGYYFEFLKIIVIALFTTGQVDSRQRLRLLLWTIALSLGFYGFKGGAFGFLTGGAIIQRGPGGMLEDNNDFALALVMNLPLLFYLGQSEKNLLIRRFTEITMALTMITILLTHSRGAFVAMIVTLLVIAWRSGKLFQAVGGLTLLVVCFLAFTPKHVLDRLASIGQGTVEESANARLRAWKVAGEMIQDNPAFGVGMRNFRDNFYLYSDGGVFNHVAHNSYLQIWAEGGSFAFLVYMALLLSVFFTCSWVRRVARMRPDMSWAGVYARMMEATTAGFMIGAFFLDRGHFDLIYHWLGLVTCLALIVRSEYARSPEHARTEAKPGIRVRWRTAAVLGPRELPRWGRGV